MPFDAGSRAPCFVADLNMTWYYTFMKDKNINVKFDDSGYSPKEAQDHIIKPFEMYIESEFNKYVWFKLFGPDRMGPNPLDLSEYSSVWAYLKVKTLEYVESHKRVVIVKS